MRSRIIKLKLKQIFAIAKKNMKIYYFEPPVLIFGLLFPAFLFLAFYQGRQMPIDDLFPGLLGIIFFFGGSSVGPFIVPWETRTKTLERVLCAPISVSVLILGDIVGGFIFGVIFSSLILIIGMLFFEITIKSMVLLLLAIFISAFCFASLGTIFSALPTDKPSNVMMLSNLIRLPIIFISGVFVPINQLSSMAKLVAPLSPVTYVTDLMRYLLMQESYFSVTLNFTILSIFSIILFSLSVYFHRKTLLKRI
ncbi:ABC transporter permease [Natroniella acetigena]|uniref:ABC transporter permease n=1 Tax=Natroniella acetigena TaxID=52004 RepID=UPI002009DF8F|nr:ABC transporter permease [Natroniella acetigena]MCK8827225.1 ABC transporter permease [Natroniella acetigena]